MSQSRWALMGLFLSASAGADPAGSATSIWYRSSDRCPDGVAFLERLEQLGRSARLADAGDTIDFVVTLGSKDGGSFGRLERQTERGTVAIREVEAPACVEVADALALSLDLALDPGRGTGATPPTAVVPAAPTAAEGATPQLPPTVPESPPSSAPAPAMSAPVKSGGPDAGHDEAPLARAAAVARVGVQGTLVTGVGDAPLPGAAIFGELPLGAVTGRLSVLGATGASTIEDSTLRLWLFAAHVEGCVGRFGGHHLYFHPCAGVDLGVVGASYAGANGGNDTAPWVSPQLLGRGVWSMLERVTLEAQIGLYVPIFSYDVGEPGEEPLTSTDPVGVQAAVGLGLAL